MKNTLKQLCASITLCSLAGTASAAIAIGSELITDGSFEDLSGPFGGGNANRLYLDSWFEENDDGGNGTAAFTEAGQAGGVNNTPTADDGTFWLNLAVRSDPAAVYQNIGTWSAGGPTDFSFSAVIGERTNTPDFVDMTFEIWHSDASTTGADGSTLSGLAGANRIGFTTTFGQSDLGPISETISINTAGVSVGDEIWFRVVSTTADGSGNNQNLVDSVSVTAIPETSTLAMLGIALGSMLLIRRTR